VAVLAINLDAGAAHELGLPLTAERYTLTAKDPMDNRVDLNGSELKLTAGGDVPAIAGVRAPAGAQALPPASISFFAIPQANNAACRSAK
jgi:hypothetical protein